MSQLTHLDEQGAARMVDVGGKEVTGRIAVAGAYVCMLPQTLALLEQGAVKKGDVLAVARIAGIQAAKKMLRPYSPVPSPDADFCRGQFRAGT
jgi:cyclic pyranopterin phosphate synthase